MELSLPHALHLFNIFREYDGKDNCAQVLEEECIRMFGTKYLNDEHDCNVVSVTPPIQSYTSHARNMYDQDQGLTGRYHNTTLKIK